MKAARFHGKEDLRVEEVPEPSPGPGQVKLRNAFAGICGSDLYFYFLPESLPFGLDTPHPLTGAHLPQVLGHEFAGTVVEVGEGVTGVEVGDRGAVYPMSASCGECTACGRGLPFSCRLMGSLGASAPGGGLSEFATFDASLKCLRPRGYFVSFGATTGSPPPVEAGALQKHGSLFFTRPTLVNYIATRDELTASAAAMFDLLQRGALRVHIGARYPLADAARAHADLEAGKTVGSSVLTP